MAGMMPGVILAICLCIYIAFISKKRKYPKSVPPQLGAYLRYCFKAIWALLTPVILLVGIYTGVMTPTEAGAIAGAYALLIAVLVYHILNWEGLKQVIFDTVKGTGSVSIMVGAASAISFIFAKEQIGVRLGNWITSFTDSKYVFLIMVNIIILVLGMIMDMAPIILIATPILLPIATSIGIDPIQFGIIVVLNCGIGLLTPPVGSVLFIGSAVAKRPMEKVVKATLPFYLCMFVALLLLTYVPDISLAIPKLLGGYVSPITNPLGPVFIH